MRMNKNLNDLSHLSCSSLVELFAEAAAANGHAWENAKPRLANNAYGVKVKVFRELRSRGIEAQRSLLSLLDHPDRYVRCAAGTYALDFDPQAAEPVLLALEKLRGFSGHHASLALEMWRKGELRFS
jgi:hypothetical protein